MKQTISLRDGAIGYSASPGQVVAMLGVATAGPTDSSRLCATPSAVQDTYTRGKLVDRCGTYFEQGAPGALLVTRCAAGTAGSIPAYNGAIATALAGNNAGNAFAGISFVGPRNIEVAFAAAWDGGNILITGTDVTDTAQTETITASAGNTVKGAKVFKTVTAIAKGAVGAAADTAAPKYGNKTAALSGTDAQLALSGTPLEDLDVIAQVTRDGSVGAGTSACKISYDGGDSFDAETPIPAGGVVTGQYGLTFTFTGSALKSGDAFRQLTIGPTATTNDLSAALAVLAASQYSDFRFLHIIGALTGAQAAVVNAWVNSRRAVGQWFQVLCEVRDYNSGESDATWQASLLSDFASLVAPYGQLSGVPGHWETVMPAGRGIQRRSWAWSVGNKIASTTPGKHPGAPGEAGPLDGMYTPITGVQPNTHDERLQPGLGGSSGRFLTVQTHLGRDFLGQWYIGDGDGLRSPGTFAAGTSDYSLWTNVELVMILAKALQLKNTLLLGRQLATKKDGTLFEWAAKKLDKELTAWAKARLVTPGYAQGVNVVVSRTEPIYSTLKLPYSATVKPFALVQWVAADIGFEAAIVA